jgi:hypothetical protein
MKNFDDFLKTVDMNKLVSPTVDVIENSDNPISAISALSTSITINLLRQYHEWNSEQQN